MPNCQVCRANLNESNIGYACISEGIRVFECRNCHTAPRRMPKESPIKAWQLSRTAPRMASA